MSRSYGPPKPADGSVTDASVKAGANIAVSKLSDAGANENDVLTSIGGVPQWAASGGGGSSVYQALQRQKASASPAFDLRYPVRPASAWTTTNFGSNLLRVNWPIPFPEGQTIDSIFAGITSVGNSHLFAYIGKSYVYPDTLLGYTTFVSPGGAVSASGLGWVVPAGSWVWFGHQSNNNSTVDVISTEGPNYWHTSAYKTIRRGMFVSSTYSAGGPPATFPAGGSVATGVNQAPYLEIQFA